MLFELVSVRSVSGTKGECDAAAAIVSLIREDPYFREHPDLSGAYDGHDYLERPVVWALKKGSGRKTLILTGHYDTVGTSHYGNLEPLALSPEKLRAAMLESPPENEGIKKDLADERWLFGRGGADMKGGLAAALRTLCEYIPGSVNLLFVAVSDEESMSAGARQAVALYGSLREKHGLDYTLAVFAEPVERDPDEPFPLVCGSAGKILPVAVAKGIPAHGAMMLDGINSAHLTAGIIRRTEYDDGFVSSGMDAVFTQPPALQWARDLKQGYDVSMPEYAACAFNVTFFSETDPSGLLGRFTQHCRDAVSDVLARREACVRLLQGQGRLGEVSDVGPVPVMSVKELESKLSAKAGFDRAVREAKEKAAEIAATGEGMVAASVSYIRDILTWHDGPAVAVGVTPPFYPAAHCGEGELVEKIRSKLAQSGIQTVRREYSTAMMDLSYLSVINASGAKAILDNLSIPAEVYDVDIEAVARLAVPSLVIGPAGRDIHLPGERVWAPDIDRLPQLYGGIIEALEEEA